MRYSPTVLILALIIPNSALAQGTRSGGLFAGTRAETATGSRLNVVFVAAEAYDSDVPAEFRTRLPIAATQSAGLSTMLLTSLDYAHVGRRWHLNGSGNTAFRYYPSAEDITAVSHSGAAGARLNLSRTSTLELSQTAAYSPSYFFQLFPAMTPPEVGETTDPAPDFRVDTFNSYTYGTRASAAMGSVRGNRMTVSMDYGRTQFERQSLDRPNLATYGGAAIYSRGVRRNVSITAGYYYRAGDFGSGPAVEHSAHISAEYSRPLATSRRATFRVTLSPSRIDLSRAIADGVVPEKVHRLHADAAVDYQFRRTWHAGASFRRSMEYVPLLLAPVYADGISLNLAGLLTRRIDVSASAGSASGASALTARGHALDSYTGTVRFRFAALRSLAVYSEYLYYFYDLGDHPRLAPALPARVEQHGIRFGLMMLVL